MSAARRCYLSILLVAPLALAVACDGGEPATTTTTSGALTAAGAKCMASAECGEGAWCRKKVGTCASRGLCSAAPVKCPPSAAPVCGCDGETYPSACLAAQSGAAVDHHGACVPPACEDSAQCPDGMYCRKQSGACDSLGKCTTASGPCPYLWQPVCGCDGETWANACVMAQAGVSKLHDGECEVAACQEIDPWGFGVCAMFLGYGFDGSACVGVSGCGCGDLCDAFHPTLAGCEEVCADELNPCVAEGGFCSGPFGVPAGAKAPPLYPECPPGSAEVDLGGCGDWEVCCFETEPCIPEGGSGAVYPGTPPCCPGLVSIPCGGPIAGECQPCVGSFSCTACGDGVCAQPENECTCPKDCGAASCVAVDPHGYGDCLAVLGVAFDGAQCVGVSGCDCGADCALFFESMQACEAACDLAP